MAGIPISAVLAREIPPFDLEEFMREHGLGKPGEHEEFSEELDYIKNVEKEFIDSADEVLKMLNLSHLKVKPQSEG